MPATIFCLVPSISLQAKWTVSHIYNCETISWNLRTNASGLPFNRMFLEYRIPNRKLTVDNLRLLHAAISCNGKVSISKYLPTSRYFGKLRAFSISNLKFRGNIALFFYCNEFFFIGCDFHC